MKKYVLLLVFMALTFVSCESDDRTPLLMRATTNNFFFDAVSTVAVQDPVSGYTISGTGEQGVITLFVDGILEGNYDFAATQTANYALYQNPNGDIFDTRVNALGRGRITVSSINQNAKTLSGTFRFVAFRGSNQLEFRTGVFENVSYAATATEGEGVGN